MKIINATNETRSTWAGLEVNAGDALYTDGIPDNEVEWLLRHGFKKVTKPKPKPAEIATADETTADVPVYRPSKKTPRRR